MVPDGGAGSERGRRGRGEPLTERAGSGHVEASELAFAYRVCEAEVLAHYENFTVASRLLPQSLRPHLAAIYAYCRTVDDLGDEFAGDRMKALDAVESVIRSLYGEEPGPRGDTSGLRPEIVRALGDTIAALDLPAEPFLRLIEANRMDQERSRFQTFEELRAYTRLSAEPVGHLVLLVFGYRDEWRMRLSDETCTALQLANFWQDVGPDLRRGRLYIPLEDLDRYDLAPEALGSPGDPRVSRLMAMEVARARAGFALGAPLEETVPLRLRLQLRLYRLGGEAILAALERQGLDPFVGRPHLGPWAKFVVSLRALGGPWGSAKAPRAGAPDVSDWVPTVRPRGTGGR